MASYTTVADWQDVESGYVVDVTIRQTKTDTTYPSGWKYSLHFGEVGGETILRYTTTLTNARKDTNVTHTDRGRHHRISGDAHAVRPFQTGS